MGDGPFLRKHAGCNVATKKKAAGLGSDFDYNYTMDIGRLLRLGRRPPEAYLLIIGGTAAISWLSSFLANSAIASGLFLPKPHCHI
jgi:hypothetical protein